MFKIGDFSRIGQVSVRMLRHYDKLGLLKPSHTDKFSSYRYYTIEQLARLHRIVALNGIGLTLQQISGLIDKDGGLPLDQLRGMLIVRQAELAQELNEKQAQLSSVAARLEQLEQQGQPSPYEIVIKSVAPLRVAGIRHLVPSAQQMGEYCGMLYQQLYTGLAKRGIVAQGDEITLYHNEEYSDIELDVEAAIVVDPNLQVRASADESIRFHEIPAADLTAALIYEGPYDGLEPPVLALLAWVGQQGYTLAGPLRELHLSGPAHITKAQAVDAVLELQIPIRKQTDRDDQRGA